MGFRAKCWLKGWWSEVGDIPETVMTTRASAMLKINQNSLQRGKAGKKWEFLTEIFSEMIPKRIIFPFRHPEDWGQANKWEKWWKHPPGSSIIWNPPLETVKTYFCDFVWWNLPRPDLPRTCACADCQDHLRDGVEQLQDPAEQLHLELWCKRHRFEPALQKMCFK